MIEQNLWAEPRGAYAILALLALGALGATLAPGGLRNPRRIAQRLVAGSVLVGAALSLLWPQITGHRTMELDPAIDDVGQLAGKWRDGADTLSLNTDGTYSCHGSRCNGFGPQGTWTRAADGAIVVRSRDGHDVPWRVVRYRGRLRLAMLPDRSAGATWDAQLSFEHLDP
ncbi:MAG: hypothetical protein ABJE47_19285 [bacterium]